MKLFAIRGGIHPDYRKEFTADKAIVVMPLSRTLTVPLQQHAGAAAISLVAVGDLVRKGQLIASGQGAISAPIHAPTSGRITDVGDFAAPHPSGLSQTSVVIETDGKEEWVELPAPLADPFSATQQEIGQRVAAASIVGLGGAAFPSAVKLSLGSRYKLETLLLNGAECEPYLTCDDRVMREYADEVIDGARIMAHALGTPRIVVAIENNKPAALERMRKAASAFANIELVSVPVQYPMGSERHLTQAITGLETPARKMTADIGVVVHNVATARAVHHAIRFGKPLLSRVISVSGRGIQRPQNIEVTLGTKVSEVIAFCGGLVGNPKRIISGGPMMGNPLPSLEVPVVKGTSGILALTADEVNERPTEPCIRCGTCVTICPCGLVPVEMAAFIRKDNVDAAAKIGVTDCVSCGSCSYVCPSHIPLVHFFNYAKGRLAANDRERRKTESTKNLVEARNARVEKAAAAKREADALRKAKSETQGEGKASA